MKKINFCTGMLLLSLSSFAGGNNIVKTDNQVKKAEKEKEERLNNNIPVQKLIFFIFF